MLSRVLVLVRISLANIVSSFLNVFVGSVLAFGAALLVIGGSLFSTLDESLSKSVVGSITGHLQVYGARSKDALEVYGKIDGSDSNLAPLDDFPRLKATLLGIPNVKQVVPMGAATAMVSSGNTIDLTLEKLRDLYRAQRSDEARLEPAEFDRRSKSLKAHVQNMVSVLVKDSERAAELVTTDAIDPAEHAALTRAVSEDFWATFDDDPFGHLELLENQVAPQVGDSDMLFVRYIGTDLDAYQKTFDRMTIVEGGPVPPGHRGVLLPRLFCEDFLKLKNARRLDKIRDARAAGRRIADPSDKELTRMVKENQSQTKEFILQLDALKTATAVKKLQGLLGSKDTDLAALLSRFFDMTDDDFEARYRFFYAELAPDLTLYRAKVGDSITLRSVGRSGSVNSALVKVYGIFEFRGLEKSPLAAVNTLVDIVTFRDLYGYLTSDAKAEQQQLKAEANAKVVTRANAEAELFGGDAPVVEEAHAQRVTEPPSSGKKRTVRPDTFALEDVDHGVVLNAAIILKDGSPLALTRARSAIEAALATEKPPVDPQALDRAAATIKAGPLPFALSAALGSVLDLEKARRDGKAPPADEALLGLEQALKSARPALSSDDVESVEGVLASAKPRTWVVDWATAAGFLGQFITFFRMMLVGIVAAFAFIALIVVTIGVTIATLQRTVTIGTLRAIGAQREFVVGMVLVETMVLAVVFGILGAAAGAAVVGWMHASGIPAFRDELYFFFSGPVLRPELSFMGLAMSVGVTLLVSLLAVLFPVYLATRVSPLTAMQSAE